jgi:hypothetical protein
MLPPCVKLAVACAAVLAAGCATQPGFVAKEWAKNIRELGVYPVFPPREDFQVGDVYLAPTTPEREAAAVAKADYLPIGVWIGRRQRTLEEISTFYATRPEFPKTTTGVASAAGSISQNPFQIVPEPESSGSTFWGTVASDGSLSSGNNKRLRLVGFPEFLSTSYSGFDLSGLIPVDALQIAFGATATDVKSVSLKVPVAASYGLPAALVVEPLIGAGKLKVTELGIGSIEDMKRYVPDGQKKDGADPDFVYVDIITEVFLARAIDIEIAFQSSFGARVGTPSGGSASGTQPGVGDAGASGGPSGSAGTSKPAPATAQDLATQSQERANELFKRYSAPGATLGVVAASAGGVTMRRTYERPMAIGYRGTRLKVSLKDGSVIGSGSSGGIHIKRLD